MPETQVDPGTCVNHLFCRGLANVVDGILTAKVTVQERCSLTSKPNPDTANE